MQAKIDSMVIIQKHLETGREFLDANRLKKGVKTLPSGLQYKVLKKGNGPIPKPTDEVVMHRCGTVITANWNGELLEGFEFDNSHKRGEPDTFRIDTAVEGLSEALQLMKVGSKWKIMIPPELAYKDVQAGNVPPQSTLIMEVELLSIKGGKTR